MNGHHIELKISKTKVIIAEATYHAHVWECFPPWGLSPPILYHWLARGHVIRVWYFMTIFYMSAYIISIQATLYPINTPLNWRISMGTWFVPNNKEKDSDTDLKSLLFYILRTGIYEVISNILLPLLQSLADLAPRNWPQISHLWSILLLISHTHKYCICIVVYEVLVCVVWAGILHTRCSTRDMLWRHKGQKLSL